MHTLAMYIFCVDSRMLLSAAASMYSTCGVLGAASSGIGTLIDTVNTMAFVNSASLALGGHDPHSTEEQEQRVLAPVDTTLLEY